MFWGDILNSIFVVVIFNIVWFKTDAFVEYCKLFSLNKLFKFLQIDEYIEYNRKNYLHQFTYPEAINSKYNNWLTRLLNCHTCLSFPISVIVSILFGCIYWLPVVYLISLIVTLEIFKREYGGV